MDEEITPKKFEEKARTIMSTHYKTEFQSSDISGWPKKLDYVSHDKTIAGDAKYYSMVGGEKLPPAKFSIIAEHVWILEKIQVKRGFLVFGNDKRVPVEWLKRYSKFVNENIDFFFIDNDGTLEQLK